MSLVFSGNETIKSAVNILESVSESQQKRMLYLLKLEKSRSLARKLDKQKPRVKKTDKQIADMIHRVRKSYGRK